MFASHGSNAAAKKLPCEIKVLLEGEALSPNDTIPLFLPLLIPDYLETNSVHVSYIV